MIRRNRQAMSKMETHSYFNGLTEEQEQAIYSDSNLIGVDASAGSGKTRVLIARILRLLKEGKADLSEIVAITFTEKASAEMRQRLRDAFHEYARTATPEELTQWRWREQQLETARISTIHSFCTGILRQYALKLGFDPEFRILDELQSPLFLDKFIQNHMDTWLESYEDAAQLATELSLASFRNAIEVLFQKPLHILPWLEEAKQYATPDEYLEHRIPRLEEAYKQFLQNFIHSNQINIWIQRLDELNQEIPETESKLKDICQWYYDKLVDLQNSNSMEEIIQKKEEIGGKQIRGLKTEDSNKELAERFKKIRKDIKDTLDKEIITINWDNATTRKSLVTTYRLFCLFDHLYSQWVQYKRQQGMVDFDDLINLTRLFLSENEEVCKEIADGIKYIFIDEFQDTDREQVQLIHLLLEAKQDISLFFVGDAKQSIYAFRNAEVKVFREQRELVEKDNLFLLDYNFRSAKEILDFINTFFKRTNYLSEVEEEYRCMKHQRSGYNEPRVEFLLSTPLDMDKRTLKEDNVDIEANVIADRIQSLVEGNNPLKIIEEEKERSATYGDFTLLFCTKNYIYKYEKALKDKGIPCYVVSSRGFFEITEVKDIMDFLHVLLNPYHDVSLLAFLRGPFCGLSDEQIVHWQMQIPLRKMLLDLATIPEPLSRDPSYLRVRTLYQNFLKKTNMPIHELVQSIIDETGYKAILLGQWFGKQKIANLQKFLSLVRAYQENNPISLYQFHRFVERTKDKILEGEADLAVEKENAVILTTIHQAKGLEFPIVVLPTLYEERQYRNPLPVCYHREIGVVLKDIEKGKDEDGKEEKNIAEFIVKLQSKYDEYQEYIRLFYVALTRARDYLILSSNKKHFEDLQNNLKINSRLSLLASCFPIGDFKKGSADTNSYRMIEMQETEFSAKKQQKLQTKKDTIIKDLISPISITTQQLTTEPIPVTRLLDWLFEDEFDEDKDEGGNDFLDASYAERGTLYHQILRYWDFEKGEEPSLDYLLDIVMPNISEEIIEKEKANIKEKITNNSAYPMLMANPPVYRELPFLWKAGQYIVKGTVDAILTDGTIIDYKTGKRADEHSPRYWKQLEIYYHALHDAGIKLNKKLILLYIDQIEYDIKDIEFSGRDLLISEINQAIENRIKKLNQGKRL